MGKKYRNLFNLIANENNLMLAYYKASLGKNKYSKNHLEFKENLNFNIITLKEELLSGEYKIGAPHSFYVYDPKKRLITALPFRDRVVQHAIYNIIEPLFDKKFYACSYGCRVNKGTHKGAKDVQARIRKMSKKGEVYSLKMDFKKYFTSINVDILIREIQKTITCRKTIELIKKFFAYGVKIGYLLSQLGANVFGNIYDRFVKTKLREKNYFRYIDDSVILHHSIAHLKRLRIIISKFVGIFLKLKFSRWSISNVQEKSVNFLGYRIRKTSKLIRKSSLLNAKRKIKRYLSKGQNDKLLLFMASWRGHIKHADNAKLIKTINRWGYVTN